MSRTFHIDSDNGLVTIRLNGALRLADVHDLAAHMAQDPAYHPELPQLIDCRGMQLATGRAELRSFATYALRFYRTRSHKSIAIVVDPTLNRERMAGIYRLACAMQVAELFDDYELALKWLMRREFACRVRATGSL